MSYNAERMTRKNNRPEWIRAGDGRTRSTPTDRKVRDRARRERAARFGGNR